MNLELMNLSTLQNAIWEADPGYARFKQACKTVLALLIVGLMTIRAPMPVTFFAAISAGFSMQAIVGGTRKAQIKFILIVFPVYFVCYTLGHFLKLNSLFSSILLVVLGFLAIYVKRFGPEFNFAPIIAWTFAFLGVILPKVDLPNIYIFLSLILGFGVAGLIYLYVYPERKHRWFFYNINKFLDDYALTLQWLANLLIHKPSISQFITQRDYYRNHLFRITMFNADIAQSIVSNHNKEILRINKLYVKQYALSKILSMIMEAFETLMRDEINLSDVVKSHLFTIFSVYATAISNLRIKRESENIQEIVNTLSIMAKYLDDFQNAIIKCIITKKQSMIPLVNLNLGLRLIYQNIQKLEQIDEK